MYRFLIATAVRMLVPIVAVGGCDAGSKPAPDSAPLQASKGPNAPATAKPTTSAYKVARTPPPPTASSAGKKPEAAPLASGVPVPPAQSGNKGAKQTKNPKKQRKKRRYQFFEPKTSAPVPLLVVLHGYGSSARMIGGALQLRRAARKLGVAIAVPNGTKDRTKKRFWNATDACCDFDNRQPDDVAAVRRLVRRVRKRRAIRKGRIAVLGYSNGAFMAHRLACDASDLVSHIVAVSGTTWSNPSIRCKPKQPVALLQMHGINDQVVPFSGGKVLGRKNLPGHASAPDSVAFWAKANGCGPATKDQTRHVHFPVKRTRYENCQATTELWAVQGVGHSLGLSLRTIERLVRAIGFGT